MILRPPRSTLFPYPTLSRSSHEAKRDAVALGDPGDREIGGSTDQCAVAAQASAEREAPPQRLDIVETAIGGSHALDQRGHGGHERKVVDDRGEEGRRPQKSVTRARPDGAPRRPQLL